jgi:polyribonucleotide nucleotidyltransferase
MHNFNITRRELDFCGRKLIVETGKMAKQRQWRCFRDNTAKQQFSARATMSKDAQLLTRILSPTVDYIEKMYAAGKIQVVTLKRETKTTPLMPPFRRV